LKKHNLLITAQLSVSLLCGTSPCFSQPSPASCVHGGGLQYFLNTYLASLGACNCKRTGVFLTSFPKCNTDPYVLDFEDNFENDSLDLFKWQLSPSIQGALEGAQSVELRTLNNIKVENGICHIVAKKETIISRAVNYKGDHELLEDGKENLRTYNFTSSLLVSRRTFFHGKYEIKCRMPKGNGFWPAFWTFGGERYNEIDIFDNYSGVHELVNCIYHDFDGDGKPSGCKDRFKGFDFSDWHTFGCLFEKDQITFLVDDRTVNIIYRVLTSAREPVLCDDGIANGSYFQLNSFPLEPMKIIFNLALISKTGPGSSIPVDETTPFPSSFDVDYIKFWKRTEEHFEVYPVPTGESVFISSSNSKINSIDVLNLGGEKIANFNIGSLKAQLDFSIYPDAIYFLNIKYDGGSQKKKVAKIAPK
jgi:beta-glucanase (GH16 family)